MWKRFLTAGIGVIVAVVAASAQGTSSSGSRAEFVVIGCLERAQNDFMLRDNRSGTRYRLDATADALGWHVGHELEIHGTFQSGQSGATREAQTLKVGSVVYISQKCSQDGGKGK